VIITFAIAALSYRVVERPIREGTVAFAGTAKRTVIVLVVATVALAGAILALTNVPYDPNRDPGGRVVDALGCSLIVCVRVEAADPDAPVVALVGDSIARSLDAGFLDLARREGWTYVMAATGGCRVTHLLTSVDGASAEYEPCYDATPGLWDELVTEHDPDLIVMLDTVEQRDFVGPQGRVVTAEDPEHLETERAKIAAVAETFTSQGARLAIVAFPPFVLPPDCFRDDVVELGDCAAPASADTGAIRYTEMLQQAASQVPGASVVSIGEHLCPDGVCTPTVDGVFPRYDGYHFTMQGARWLVPLLHEELVAAGAYTEAMR
jgi:hypothetical protein